MSNIRRPLCSPSLVVHPLPVAFAVNACFCLAAHAQIQSQASDQDIIRPYIGYSFTSDSNVLGLHDVAMARRVTGGDQMSDTSRTVLGGVAFDKTIGLQKLTANLGASKTTYSHFERLNNEGRDLAANWRWQVGSNFQGNVGMTEVKALTPFVNFHELERNTRTLTHKYIDGSWWFHPSWKVNAGVSTFDVLHDIPALQSRNREESRADFGVTYQSRTGSRVGILARHTSGKNLLPLVLADRAITNGFTQDEIKGNVVWQISSKTQMQFTGGHVSRKHDTAPERDFSGPNGRLTLDWAPTGKTAFQASVWRETGVIDDWASNYSVNTGVSVGPKWVYSDKLQIEAQLKIEKHDFNHAFVPLPVQVDLDDKIRTISATVSYRPWQKMLLQAGVFHLQRTSLTPGSDFNRRGLTLSAQYQF